MQISKQKNNDVLVVNVSGRVDANTAPAMEAAITEDLDGISQIHLELGDLEYISSAGLRVLLTVHKLMAAKGGSFIILHPCDEVSEIFEMTGFSSFLVIEK